MKISLLLFFSLIVFQSFAIAQTDKSICPTFTLESKNLPRINDEDVIYKVIFNKAVEDSKLVYVWTVDYGRILKGQGTSSILSKKVDLVYMLGLRFRDYRKIVQIRHLRVYI